MPGKFDIRKDIEGVQEVTKDMRELYTQVKALVDELVRGKSVFESQSKSQKDLANKTNQLTAEEKELEAIRKRSEKLTLDTIRASEELKKKRKDLTEQVKKENGETQKSVSFTDKMTNSFKSAFLQVTIFIGAIKGAVTGLIKLDKAILYVNKQTSKVSSQFKVSREEARKLTGDIRGISAAFDADFNDVLKSSNILMKEFDLTGSQALDLISKGFEKGANVNGEFLELLKEYPAQLKTVGFNASETIAIITQTEKEGVFSDKGIDAIKEAGIRLREMTPATQDALNSIGLSAKTIQNELEAGSKSLFEVTQQVSQKLSELPPQSKEVGTAIADIFGGAGEDAGLRFLTTLKDIDTELNNLPATLSDAEKAQIKLTTAWADFIFQLTKGDGVIASTFSNLKNQSADALNSLSTLSLLFKRSSKLTEEEVDRLTDIVLTRSDQLGDFFRNLNSQISNAAQEQLNESFKFVEENAKKIGSRNVLIYTELLNRRQEQLNLEANQLAKAEQQKLEMLEKSKNLQIEQQKQIFEARQKSAFAKESKETASFISDKAIQEYEYGLNYIISLNDDITNSFENLQARETKAVEDNIKERERIELESMQKIIDKQKEKEETVKQIKEEAINAAGQFAFDRLSANIDNELAAYTEQQEEEKALLQEKLDNGEISEKEYQEKIAAIDKKIKIKQAQADKRKALYDIAINTAVGIAKAIPNLVLMGVAAATGALQAAVVAAKPIPAFRHGGIMHESGLARFSEGGKSELAVLPSGKAILTPEHETIGFVPKGTHFYSSGSPETRIAKEGGITIEKYEELIKSNKAIENAINRKPVPYLNIDKDGIHNFIIKGRTKIEYLNSKNK